jgi:signal transduction histidine kinase
LLTEQRRQLIELNRVKDEFISLASHQLRTPATGVKQYLGMILEGYAGVDVPPELRHMIEVAYASNERQLKIVNDLLKVASVDAGKVKIVTRDCDMTDLVDAVLNESRSVYESRNQKVVIQNNCKQYVVRIDDRLMRMVLENIIDNASKYSPEGKTITIDLKCTKKYLTIKVQDEGVGIAPQDLDKLFRKFSRIDNELSTHVGGTGLGLYWARHVVELHNGKILVSSEPGKGSTFTIRLPMSRSID